MKKLKLVLVLSGMMCLQQVFAQNDAHLKISDAYPAPGEKIMFTYDPAGTPVDGKSDLNAAVYFLDNKDYPVTDINLKSNGKLLKGDFTIPASAKAFFIKISKDEVIDDNNEKGYLYLIYKDKKPVEGAYASKAYFLSSSMGVAYARIKIDPNEGFLLYKQEFQMYPQSEKEYQMSYCFLLASGKNPAFAPVLNQKLNNLMKSNNETNLILARNLLKRTKNEASADSLRAVIKAKYPNGRQLSDDLISAFFKEKDLVKKEALYGEYLKKYPEDPAEKLPVQDYFRMQLASAYLQQGKMEDFVRWNDQLKDKTELITILNKVAYDLAKKGEQLDEAAKLSKESLDLVKAKINNPGSQPYFSQNMLKKRYEWVYDKCADTYAYIQLKQNKPKEALTYEQPVFEKSKGNEVAINDNYTSILKALGEDQKAKQVIEAAIKIGKSSDAMNANLKTMYVKEKGSDTGYDQYFASLKNAAANAAREKLAKEMINKPAPLFTLKDTSGKVVSLADLKGKVVVIDFWATWCGPCKASFPGMQLAVNKYKDDPNVQFLFIDTWENGDDYFPGVKKFIADNHYTFNVLMDEKGSDKRQSKVVSTYDVPGIPTKFVLDKNGNIRFKHVGFEGTAESLRDEMTMMIEMATNPETVATKAEKVSMTKSK